MADLPQPPARTLASRRKGARSQGPRTAAGKLRSSRSAVKHGLRARRMVLLDDENPAEFRALARALPGELAPEGALQTDLVNRIVIARGARRSAPTSVVGRRSGATTGGLPAPGRLPKAALEAREAWEPADGSQARTSSRRACSPPISTPPGPPLLVVGAERKASAAG